MQGPRTLRSEVYFLYAAMTKGEGNAADERFSAAFLYHKKSTGSRNIASRAL